MYIIVRRIFCGRQCNQLSPKCPPSFPSLHRVFLLLHATTTIRTYIVGVYTYLNLYMYIYSTIYIRIYAFFIIRIYKYNCYIYIYRISFSLLFFFFYRSASLSLSTCVANLNNYVFLVYVLSFCVQWCIECRGKALPLFFKPTSYRKRSDIASLASSLSSLLLYPYNATLIFLKKEYSLFYSKIYNVSSYIWK